MVYPILTNFTAGELSAKFFGRVDLERWQNGAAGIQNFVIHPYGGACRRSGTVFVAETKGSAAARMVPFVRDESRQYILEFGPETLRVFKDHAQVLESGSSVTPYEIATPYLAGDLWEFKYDQDADVMYIAHPDHAPRKLMRFDDDWWELVTVIFGEERLLAGTFNASTGWTLGTGWSISGGVAESDGSQAGDADLSIACTVSNGDDYVMEFQLVDCSAGTLTPVLGGTAGTGRTAKGFYRETITAGAAGTAIFRASANFVGTIDNGSVKPEAMPEAWFAGNYPGSAAFFEGRLWWGGTPSQPLGVWSSKSAEPENMSTGAEDDDGLEFVLRGAPDRIKWMLGHQRLIMAGSSEWTMGARSSLDPITPTNYRAERETRYGTANVQGLLVNSAILYLSTNARRFYEFGWSLQKEGYESRDITLIAEHITASGIKEFCWAENPDPLLFGLRNDGVVIVGTYYPPEQVMAWTRLVTDGEFVSLAAIPTDTHDEVWAVVKRTIGGVDKHFVEYFQPLDWGEYQEDIWFVDSGLALNTPVDIADASCTDPVVITTDGAHGFANGDTVRIVKVGGMTEINERYFRVANKTSDTFELEFEGSGLDGTDFGDYTSGGEVRKCVTSVTGADHLEGETVQVLTDGYRHPPRVVSGGGISLQHPAGQVTLGLGFTSDLQTLPIESPMQDGTGQTRLKAIPEVAVRFYQTLGGEIGPDADNLLGIKFLRTEDIVLGRGARPITEDVTQKIKHTYNRAGQIFIRQGEPLPMTILGIVPTVEVTG